MRLLTNAQHEALVAKAALADGYEALWKAAEERCQRWETLWKKANERAERAIDAQLAVRGFPTVTPREGMPEIPDGLAEDPEEVARVEQRMKQGDAAVFMERF